MALGARLREARKARDLTQQQLADAIGWDQGGIGNTERRDSTSCSHSSVIAKTLNISLDWLLTGSGEMECANEASIENLGINKEKTIAVPSYSPADLIKAKTYYPGIIATAEHSYQDIERMKMAGANPFFVFETFLVSNNMYPTIAPNTAIRVDSSKKSQSINSTKIYALLVNGEFLLRRLTNQVDGSILMYSDNSFYKDEMISADLFSDRVTILGWVFDWTITESW